MSADRVALCQSTRTGTAIATRVQQRWLVDGWTAEVVGPDADPPAKVDHLLAVVPVLGDERMPDAMEESLRRWAGHSRTHRVCLTGDFRTGQRTSPVADEADRILTGGGSDPLGPPVLVDTPLDAEALTPLVDRLVTIDQAAATEPSAAAWEDPARPTLPDPCEPALQRLMALLPVAPRVGFDVEGRCVSLVLLDAAPYQRSLLLMLPPRTIAEVLDLAASLPALRSFGLPFARLRELPAPLPSGLLALDLRGNPLTRYDELTDRPSLRALNLAGCDLGGVPPQTAGLTGLRTCVLAKNRIAGDLAHLALPQLRRLTLYRNQIARLQLPFGELPELRLLNVGANPLAELPEELARLTSLEVLGLRMLPLTFLPDVVAALPRLQMVDLSKTPWAEGAVPSRPDVASCDGMPRWAWDDDEELSSLPA